MEHVTKEKWDELPWIFPNATNFPHMYVPLADYEDIYFRLRLKCMMDDREWTDEYEDEDQLDENTNDADVELTSSFAQRVLEYKKSKKKDGESSDENADTSECDDDLPF
jgi:hypothetical protein